MQVYWYFFGVLMALSPAVLAQKAEPECALQLQVRLLDSLSGSTLAAPKVFLPVQGEEYQAAQSPVVIEGLCPGPKVLLLSAPHHRMKQYRLLLKHDTTIAVALPSNDQVLEEIQVEDRRLQSLQKGQALKNKENQDFEQVLKNQGVRLQKSGQNVAKPNIHGLSEHRVRVIANGIEQHDHSWAKEHAPSVFVSNFDRIRVVKTGASVLYGTRSIGGLILLEQTAPNPEDPFELTAFSGFRSNGKRFTEKLKAKGYFPGSQSLYYQVDGGYKRGGDLHTPDYTLSNTGLEEQDASATVGIRRSNWKAQLNGSYLQRESGILRAAHIGNFQDLEAAIGRQEPWFIEDFSYQIRNPKQENKHLQVSGNFEWFFADDWSATAVGGWQRNDRKEFDIRRGGRSAIPAQDPVLRTYYGKGMLHHFPGEQQEISFGADFSEQLNTNTPGTGVDPFLPDYDMTEWGLFGQYKAQRQQWAYEGGLRLNYQHQFARWFQSVFQTFDPQLQEFDKHYLTYAAYASGRKSWENLELELVSEVVRRPPEVNELFSSGVHIALGTIEEGDTSLSPETAWKTNLLLGYQASPALRLQGSFYYNRLFNFINLRPDLDFRQTIQGAFPVFRYRQMGAHFFGTDFKAHYQVSKQLKAGLGYSGVFARNLANGQAVFGLPQDRFLQSAEWQLPTGQWLQSAFMKQETEIYLRQYKHQEDSDFMPPPDGYFLLNLYAGAEKKLGKHQLEAQLEVHNLLNRSYRSFQNRFRYFAEEPGRDIRISLTYRL